ncbi:hypothetical protein Tco_0205786 [Tanacetum coccineum]
MVGRIILSNITLESILTAFMGKLITIDSYFKRKSSDSTENATRLCPPKKTPQVPSVIMEYLVKINQTARILKLKRRNIKKLIPTSNTPYPSWKIPRICAYTSLKTTKEQDSIRRIQRILYAEVEEGQIIGLELVQETTEKISQINDRLKAARDRQKSYADKRRKPLQFSVGDYVLLKVSPWKGVVRFGKKGKLAPRFVGPFEIIEKIGTMAYRLDFPEELDSVHDTFHMSNLKKCLADPTLQVPLDEIQVDVKLNFVEESVEILEREFKKLKRSRIAIVKDRRNSKRGPEFTWEREDRMKLKYPHFFSDDSS